MSQTLLLAALLIPSLVIAIVFHEVAHGWAALMLGDPTAKEQKRLSFNPIRHVDLFGTIIVPGMLAISGGPIFGWAKPVPVVKQRLNNPRFGMMAVAAAGPAMNFLLALVGAILLGLFIPEGVQTGMSDGGGTPIMMDQAGTMLLLPTAFFFMILINCFVGIFNLLPIPPFDGSHIMEGALPRHLALLYAKLRPYGMMLFFGLIALTWIVPGLNIIGAVVGPPVAWAMDQYLSLASAIGPSV